MSEIVFQRREEQMREPLIRYMLAASSFYAVRSIRTS